MKHRIKPNRLGKPVGMRRGVVEPADLLARSTTDAGGCWLWDGCLSEGSYPRIHFVDPATGIGRTMTGPRVAAALAGLAVPAGQRSCMGCLKPRCVRPGCVMAGTVSEILRGREVTAANREAFKQNSRRRGMTPEIMMELRLGSEPAAHVAKRHGLSVNTCAMARRGLSWADVKVPRKDSSVFAWAAAT